MSIVEKGLKCPKCGEKTLIIEINNFSSEEFCNNCDYRKTMVGGLQQWD